MTDLPHKIELFFSVTRAPYRPNDLDNTQVVRYKQRMDEKLSFINDKSDNDAEDNRVENEGPLIDLEIQQRHQVNVISHRNLPGHSIKGTLMKGLTLEACRWH